ncbi:diacylglycerol/lipid kinase family protein [Pedobacter sp.]
MKIEPTKIELVHNPTAGAKEHEAEHLTELLEAAGYKVYYGSSKKKILKKVAVESKLIVVAGGDGTVRKSIIALLDKKIKYKRPIAILPLGTANNIASSLKIEENLKLNVDAWRKEKLQKLDVGLARTKKDEEYFIESFGFGLFPALVKWMDEQARTPAEDPEDEVRQAHNALLHLSKHYEAFEATLINDGKEISGKFLLLELLNISRLGPKLELAKNANPGDGKLELIMVKENQRPQLIKYFEEIIAGKKPIFPIKPVAVTHLKLSVTCKDLHVDDELKETKFHTWDISILPNLFDVVLTS